MNYRFTRDAVEDLRGFEIAIQKQIIKNLDFYARINDPLIFAKPLYDRKFGEYRFRVGEYRIIFDIIDGGMMILAIGHRRDIYR